MMNDLSAGDRELVQRFLDGQTTPEEAADCERRLKTDDAFQSACEELRKLHDLLASQGRLERDPAFWPKLSGRLNERAADQQNLLPFPQKYLPLAASGFALLVLLSFSYVFENRLSFLRFWESGSDAVSSAYQKTIEESSFIPLLSGIDNDKTLQFALYGSLPLNDAGGALLNVDERSANGYRIEVQKEQPRKQKKVTVADFVAEVRPTNVQKATIESLLTDGRRELEGAVLVGANDAVAINADLSRLNRAMASGIVSVLEPEQRTRLKRLLTEQDAAYAYSTSRRRALSAGSALVRVQVPRPENRFVVLSPETVMIQALTVDMERIHRELRESQARFREVQALRERSVQWLVNEPVIQSGASAATPTSPGISFRSRKNRFTIQIHADTMHAGGYVFDAGGVGVYVQSGDSVMQFGVQFGPDASAPAEVTVSAGAAAAAPRPDSVLPRKPFKLDID